MKDIMKRSTWDRPYAMQSWGSMVFLLCTSIIFFAAYGGTAWWVEYYPRPDGIFATDARSIGLFRMCIRGDCAIDMTNKQLVSLFAPDDLKDETLYVLPCCQWLMSFCVAFILILFVVYLGFLAGAETYFAQVWLQFIINVLIIISVSVFGASYRGQSPQPPFGWSFWLAVVALIFFFFNAVVMAFITAAVRKKDRMSPMKLYMMQANQDSNI